MELTSEKSVTSDELCVAGERIEGEANTIYSSLALSGLMTKDHSMTLPTSNGLLHKRSVHDRDQES